MKIVDLDGEALNPGDISWGGFEKLGDFTLYPNTPADLTAKRIGDAEIVLINKVVIDRPVIDACKNMKYIGVLATGYNVVDTEYAAKRGVTVTNVPAYSTEMVAQFAISLLLEIASGVGVHNGSVHAGDWAACPNFCYWVQPVTELAGKTISIIGYGKIGKAVGRIASALGMKVLAVNSRGEKRMGVGEEYAPLDDALRRGDVISLHCPLTKETDGMIDSEAISKMKDGVIIINNSRGQLINEADLATALESGKVRAAAVDVVSREPIESTNPLLGAKNCIITPHISWAAKETRERLMDISVENLEAYLRGERLNVVN